MDSEKILKIAREMIRKPIGEIDLSMYKKEEQEEINKAIDYLEIKIDAMIEENLLERRGRY